MWCDACTEVSAVIGPPLDTKMGIRMVICPCLTPCTQNTVFLCGSTSIPFSHAVGHCLLNTRAMEQPLSGLALSIFKATAMYVLQPCDVSEEMPRRDGSARRSATDEARFASIFNACTIARGYETYSPCAQARLLDIHTSCFAESKPSRRAGFGGGTPESRRIPFVKLIYRRFIPLNNRPLLFS